MDKTGKWNRTFLIIVLAVLLFLTTVPAVSALTVTQTAPAGDGTVVNINEPISLYIDGLLVTDTFSYTLTSSGMQTNSDTITLSSVNMPFSFAAGTATTSISTGGLSGNPTVTIRRLSDSSEVQQSGNPITLNNNIQKDNYFLSITGTKSQATQSMSYAVSGTVSEGGSGTMSVTMANVVSGTVNLYIQHNGVTVFSRSYSVYSPPTPAPTYTSDPGVGGGGSDWPSSEPAEPAAEPAAPSASSTSVTLDHNAAGQVSYDYSIETDPSAGFSATLDIDAGTTALSSTGQPVDSISITPLDDGGTPESGAGFSFSGMSIECGPSGTQFSEGVSISFAMTEEEWADALAQVNGNTGAMSIQYYDQAAGQWVSIPTVVDPVTRTVSAQVSHFSIYALFYEESTALPKVTPKTFGELTGESSTSTGGASVTSAYTPQAAMPASDKQMALTETTPTPGFEGIAAIGALVIIACCILRKNE